MKTDDEYFCDWEGECFGFGYGTGEPHILPALKDFFAAFGVDGNAGRYEYERLETACGATVAWLLINALCNMDVIEYGTSPRFGWLTKHGERLRAYVDAKSADALVEIGCGRNEDDTPCYRVACNCGPDGYEAGRVCPNPFWRT